MRTRDEWNRILSMERTVNIQSNRQRNSVKGMLLGAVSALVLGVSSQAALLVDFKPDPISPNQPEIILQNTAAPRALVAAPTATGSQGNADGKMAADGNPNGATPGGLIIQTPVEINSIAGYSVNRYGGVVNTGLDGPSTTFYDVSLELSDITTLNSATEQVVIPGIGIPNTPGYIPPVAYIIQKFTTGTFTLYSTYRDDNLNNERQVLLTGTVSNMVLIGWKDNESASIQASVEYTGGAILTPWINEGGLTEGTLAWSLLSVTPKIAVDGGVLRQFQANMTGLFSAPQIPEPTSIGLMALSGLGLFGRFRRQKKQAA